MLSSDCSDHAPLFLILNVQSVARPRFRFEAIWIQFDGFLDVVKEAWSSSLPNADACRALDHKLRRTAVALKRWSSKRVGSIRFQLAAARAVITELDTAQDFRQLSDGEAQLRKELKVSVLGLASMSRTIACQRARIRNLEEGDANTRFFHLQACHRKRKNFIPTLEDDGQVLSDQDAKSEKIYTYFSEVLGTSFLRCHRIDLNALSLPRLQLEELVRCFSEEEIWNIVKETPRNRVPGPDGYTGLFGWKFRYFYYRFNLEK